MDFIATTDHDYGGDDYMWWLTQKWADVFHVPGRFVPFFAYERSIQWPNGHRNVINLERGTKAVARVKDPNANNGVARDDVLTLWDKIRGQRVLTIPHTLAAGGGVG